MEGRNECEICQVKSNETGIHCQETSCRKFYHGECVKIPEELLHSFRECVGKLVWFCPKCSAENGHKSGDDKMPTEESKGCGPSRTNLKRVRAKEKVTPNNKLSLNLASRRLRNTRRPSLDEVQSNQMPGCDKEGAPKSHLSSRSPSEAKNDSLSSFQVFNLAFVNSETEDNESSQNFLRNNLKTVLANVGNTDKTKTEPETSADATIAKSSPCELPRPTATLTAASTKYHPQPTTSPKENLQVENEKQDSKDSAGQKEKKRSKIKIIRPRSVPQPDDPGRTTRTSRLRRLSSAIRSTAGCDDEKIDEDNFKEIPRTIAQTKEPETPIKNDLTCVPRASSFNPKDQKTPTGPETSTIANNLVENEKQDSEGSAVAGKSPFQNGKTRSKIKILRPKIVNQSIPQPDDPDSKSPERTTRTPRLGRLSSAIRSTARCNVEKIDEDNFKETSRAIAQIKEPETPIKNNLTRVPRASSFKAKDQKTPTAPETSTIANNLVENEKQDSEDSAVAGKSPFQNGKTRSKIKILWPKILNQSIPQPDDPDSKSPERTMTSIVSTAGCNVEKIDEETPRTIAQTKEPETPLKNDLTRVRRASFFKAKDQKTPTAPETSTIANNLPKENVLNSKKLENSKLEVKLERLPEATINSKKLNVKERQNSGGLEGFRTSNSLEKTKKPNESVEEGPETGEGRVDPMTESQIIESASESDGPSDIIESTDSGCDSQKDQLTGRYPDNSSDLKPCGNASSSCDPVPMENVSKSSGLEGSLRSKDKTQKSPLYCITPSSSESSETKSYRSTCDADQRSDVSLTLDTNETIKDLSDGSVWATCSSSFDLQSTCTSHPLSSQGDMEKGPTEEIQQVSPTSQTSKDVEADKKTPDCKPVQEHPTNSQNDGQKMMVGSGPEDSIWNPKTSDLSTKSRGYSSLSSTDSSSCKRKKLRRRRWESRRSTQSTSSDSDGVKSLEEVQLLKRRSGLKRSIRNLGSGEFRMRDEHLSNERSRLKGLITEVDAHLCKIRSRRKGEVQSSEDEYLSESLSRWNRSTDPEDFHEAKKANDSNSSENEKYSDSDEFQSRKVGSSERRFNWTRAMKKENFHEAKKANDSNPLEMDMDSQDKVAQQTEQEGNITTEAKKDDESPVETTPKKRRSSASDSSDSAEILNPKSETASQMNIDASESESSLKVEEKSSDNLSSETPEKTSLEALNVEKPVPVVLNQQLDDLKTIADSDDKSSDDLIILRRSRSKTPNRSSIRKVSTNTEKFRPLLKVREEKIKKELSSSEKSEQSDDEELDNVSMHNRKRMLIKSDSEEERSIQPVPIKRKRNETESSDQDNDNDMDDFIVSDREVEQSECTTFYRMKPRITRSSKRLDIKAEMTNIVKQLSHQTDQDIKRKKLMNKTGSKDEKTTKRKKKEKKPLKKKNANISSEMIDNCQSLLKGLETKASKEGLLPTELLSEWALLSTMEETNASGTCVCGKTDLRYFNLLYNRNCHDGRNQSKVSVGPECVLWFNHSFLKIKKQVIDNPIALFDAFNRGVPAKFKEVLHPSEKVERKDKKRFTFSLQGECADYLRKNIEKILTAYDFRVEITANDVEIRVTAGKHLAFPIVLTPSETYIVYLRTKTKPSKLEDHTEDLQTIFFLRHFKLATGNDL